MKSSIFTSVVTVCLSLFIATVQAAPVVVPSPPSLSAKAYLLMDASTGQVLVEHNADTRLGPASLTKMMTSYVLSSQLASGAVAKTDLVPISKNAWAQNPVFNGSSLMWIEVGKEVLLEDLHRGVIISSGNDASVAVAEYVAGSEYAFVDMMNQHAVRLGMTNTQFVNAHGLTAEGQYTSARDMAVLARAIIQDYPEDYAIYAEREYTYNHITQSNRNNLLWRDSSVDGLKTGHTKEAGYCLVSSSKKQGMRLISVVMGTKSASQRETESQRLLAYGYRFFESRKLYSAGESISSSKVWAGQADSVELGLVNDVNITMPRGRYKDLKAVTEIDTRLFGPIKQGKEYGELIVKLDDEVLVKEPLVALESVEKAGFFKVIWHKIILFFEGLLS